MQTKNIYKTLGFFVSVFILFTLSISHAKSESYNQITKINWRSYSKAAFYEAKQKNKPLYIFIYSDSCSWCRKFEKETLEKKIIRELIQTNFIPVLVNQMTQPELARQLGVKLIPANILITADRKKLLRFYGFLTSQALSAALGKTLERWRNGEIPEEDFGNEQTCCPIP